MNVLETPASHQKAGQVNGGPSRGPAPRMWDGGADGLGDLKSSKDLTNTKLAKNQLVRLAVHLQL